MHSTGFVTIFALIMTQLYLL